MWTVNIGPTYAQHINAIWEVFNNRKGRRIGEITTAVLTKSDSDRIVCSQLVSI